MKADRQARIVFACGAPGSGKTHYLKACLAQLRPDRLIVIDPDGEYDGFGVLHESGELQQLCQATGYATFRARFRPSHNRSIAERQFALICRLVRWHADPEPGQARPPRVGPVALVVDELADYVGPSFREAPDSWQWVVKRGRKYGVATFAASQRPAEIDKTLFSLASCIRVGRLNDPPDQARVAGAIGVPVGEIAALADHAYIERDKVAGTLTRWPRPKKAPKR